MGLSEILNMQPPQLNIDITNALDPEEIHEKLVGVLGTYLLSGKEQSIKHVLHLVESEEDRSKLARAFREPYEKAANVLSKEEIAVVGELQSLLLNVYIQYVLTLLAGTGFSLRLNEKQVARFKLTMEVCHKENNMVLHEEILNRGGRKFFPDYLKLWLAQNHKS